MAESSWPTVAGGRAVDDTQWERIGSGFAGDGVLGQATDTPVVYADASGMLIKVRGDKSALVRGHGWYSGTTEFTLAIAANTSGSTRIDLAILRFTRSTQETHIVIKQGTPGAGAPALQQDAVGAGLWEVAIAAITVVSGASTIGASNCLSVARYINSTAGNARPAWLRHAGGAITASDRSTPAAVTIVANYGNTSAPTADGPAPAPPYYNGSELTVVKSTGASRFMATISISGYSSNHASTVWLGLRLGGVNYPIAFFYFNVPETATSDQPTYTRQGPSVGGTDVNGHSIATTTADSNYTGGEYPGNWAPGSHAHSSAPHTHSVDIASQHMAFTGWNIIGAGLPPGTYKTWMYVVATGTFVMDHNDSLHIKIEEIDT